MLNAIFLRVGLKFIVCFSAHQQMESKSINNAETLRRKTKRKMLQNQFAIFNPTPHPSRGKDVRILLCTLVVSSWISKNYLEQFLQPTS